MDNYERLREILDSHPATAPKARSIDEILKTLFTPQEAAIAVKMSFRLKRPAEIAGKVGLAQDELRRHLEAMAKRGVIMAREKEGDKLYALVPLIPGVFEFPFMRGGITPGQEKLGRLWEEYHQEALGASFAGDPTPLMRVVAVDKSIAARDRVHPYEEVAGFIDSASFIALTHCACRVSVAACAKPKEVCLIFDGPAQFLVEYGFARRIDKAEGLEVLARAEEAGLVHMSNNSADRAGLICNCCPCCCTVLRGKTQLKHPHAFEPSRFLAQKEAGTCTGCGICANGRCPVKAIVLVDDQAVIDKDQCIGCGLCSTGCRAGAITLGERENPPATPATTSEMGLRVLKEKGRLEAFLIIMESS